MNKQYIIAIPSYNRCDTIKLATLNMLEKYGISHGLIYIFVASNEERFQYIRALSDTTFTDVKIIVGELGVKNQRNFMSNFFDEGQYIFYLDDDVYALYECVFDIEKVKNLSKEGNKLINLDNLHNFILNGFDLCEKLNYNLFGINPVDNPYFLKVPPDNISTNLKYIIGYCCGVINCRKAELRTVNDKEDYERSIKYYLLDGGVIRYNNICAKTRCYKEPGGLQSAGHRTWDKVDKSARFLVEIYPNLTRLNIKKKTKDKITGLPWTEIRLHDYRKGNKKIFGTLPTIKDINLDYGI